ncbi:MAG: glycosyltransferase family 2 protein [Alphaproteobacteria bacterium]|nr:glycosyltransferase family 2 protein [Alphaproteobacteria bacterium]
MKLAIVIPAFNEAATIAEVVRSVAAFGQPIVVDDCSHDDSAAIAAAAGALVVRHAANQGYDGALESGFAAAAQGGYEAVATFDADGQHDAASLGEFITALERGADLVVGERPRPARLAEAVFNLYARWRYGVRDILCGLKAYRMTLYRRHGRFDANRSIGTELALAGLRRGVAVARVEVPIHARADRSRLGSLLRANGRILRALGLAFAADLRRPRRWPTGSEPLKPGESG